MRRVVKESDVRYNDSVSRCTLRNTGPVLDSTLDALTRMVSNEYHAVADGRQRSLEVLRDIEEDLNLLVGERECERLFDLAYRTAEHAALGEV